MDKVKRLILANSLAYSQGPWTIDHGPGLLEPFVTQICIYVRGWGRRARAVVRGSRTLVDGLAEAVVGLSFGVLSEL